MPIVEYEWTIWRTLSYSMGHTMNDMCASMWFSYLLVFLHTVVNLSPENAGIVMFCGQLADGIATPLVGVLSDRSEGCPTIGFGKRKAWLLGGTILVIFCFYAVFGDCLLLEFQPNPNSMMLVVYYAIGASVFNVGWAIVQVSHMTLVPELTANNVVRCTLNSCRYAFTILSNVTVFIAFGFVLQKLEPFNVLDQQKFSILADVVLIAGSFAVLGFLIGTKEQLLASPRQSYIPCLSQSDAVPEGPIFPPFEVPSASTTDVNGAASKQIQHWYDWFKVTQFYQVAVVYMCARLVINIVQVFLPFYLMVSLKMSTTAIAFVPLIMYLAGFVATFFISLCNTLIGRNQTFVFGGVCCFIVLVLCYFTPETSTYWVYPLSIALGAANSIVLVTSICMEGDLVGNSTEGNAFVYGAMSFTDKLSNGIAIVIIQSTREAIQESYGANSVEDSLFVRQVFCLVPACAIIVGIAMTCFLPRACVHHEVKKQPSYGSF